MPQQISVVNHSKRVTNEEAALMVQACAQQLAQHLAPAWGLMPFSIVLLPPGSKDPTSDYAFAILDAPDDPGALGYHSEEKGQIFSRIFVNPVLDNKGVVLYDPKDPQNVSVASVLSHEICEAVCDPTCNRWVDGQPRKEGSEYALEVCDPVEADSYTVQVGSALVSVSNFVTPAWFDNEVQKGEKLDYLGRVRKKFSMSTGGYLVVRQGPGSEQQVFAESYEPWRRQAHDHERSRSHRRKERTQPSK